MIEDLIVYRLEPERFFVVPNASNAPRVLRMLEEEQADDRLHLMYHQDWCFLAVQGPDSVHVMRGLFPEAGDLSFMQCAESEYHRRPVIVTRSGYTGEIGFELFTYQDIARRALERPVRGDGPVRWDALRSRRPGRAAPGDGVPALRAGSVRVLDRPRSRPRLGRRVRQGRVPGAGGVAATEGGGTAQPPARARDGGAPAHPARPLPGLPGRPADRGGHERHVLADPADGGSRSRTCGRATSPTSGSEVEVDIRGRRGRATVVRTPFVDRSPR